jgi:ribonucleotide reductase alpha subunit
MSQTNVFQSNEEMRVLKRDGSIETVAFDKILTRVRRLGNEANLKINYTSLAMKVIDQLYDQISTTKIDELCADQCASLASTHPDYNILAGRIVVSNHQKNTSSSFSEVMQALYNFRDVHGNPSPMISEDLYNLVLQKGPTLDLIPDYDRDYLIDYFGFKTLEKSYLMRQGKQVLERPQHMWLRVALAIHIKSAWTDLEPAIETYTYMSQKYFTHATPTLFNAGTPRPQLSSCFLLSMEDDSIDGIYNTLKDCANISKWAGGIGLHIHNIRAQGSHIRGTNGSSNGIVPMLKVFNNTAKYVDQCVTGDTHIRAMAGFVPIKDVVPGITRILNRAISEDPGFAREDFLRANDTTDPEKESKSASPTKRDYDYATNVVEHDYEGPLLSIYTTAYGKPLRITPEHPIRTRGEEGVEEWTLASQVRAGDYIVDHDSHANRVVSVDTEHYKGTLYDLEMQTWPNYATIHGLLHNGGGKRNGSFAIYLEPWHADIEMFLQMRKNHGDEELKARDLFYALWIPDLFMERVKAGGKWTLMCPDECPGLSDVHSEAFSTLYSKYEEEGKGRKTVLARELWFQILDAQMETGTPYLLYKDAANRKSNQQNLGTIKSSNLCVAPETLVLTDQGNLPIGTLEGQEVSVWNGEEWSRVTVKKTATDAELITITVRDLLDKETRSLRCTPEHKFYVLSNRSEEIEMAAKELCLGDFLIPFLLPDEKPVSSWRVIRLEDLDERSDTYCFTEPKLHRGVFNGLLTGQCTEIIEYSDKIETAVCNLASSALPLFVDTCTNTFDHDKLHEVTKIVTRNLNNVIDINYYPTEKTHRSNMRHRPIGLGVQGLADVFLLLGLPFCSDEAKRHNREIFETIYHAALEASCELAQQDGAYETFAGGPGLSGSPASKGELQFDMWNVTPDSGRYDWADLKSRIQANGLRNSLLLAPMPTASTSQILGYNECIEPITSNIYSRRTMAGEFILANKYLMTELLGLGLWNEQVKNSIIANNGSIQQIDAIPPEIREKYKTVWELPMKQVIDMAADRGAYICQSQSLNLWIEDPNYNTLTSMHFYAWSKGLKTGIYYLRRRAKHQAQQFTIEPTRAKEEDHEICELCSS